MNQKKILKSMIAEYVLRKLKLWGISIVERPDIFDNRNRNLVVIIDESVGDAVIFEDVLTLRMTVRTLEECVCTLSDAVSDDWLCAFFGAINSYGQTYRVLLKKMSGPKWWKAAVERIEFALEAYRIDIKRLDQFAYAKCELLLGGRNGVYQFIQDCVCFEMDEMPICFVCKNCKTMRNGNRICKRCYVPVSEETAVTSLLRLTTDYPISNRILDLVKTMPLNECSAFEPREDSIAVKTINWFIGKQKEVI